MKNALRSKLTRTFVTLLVVACLPLSGAQFFVSVSENGFSPASLQIVAGDTVTWTNIETEGSVEYTAISSLSPLDPNYWACVMAIGDSCSHTFTQAGTYQYFDFESAEFGTIVVAAAPPSQMIELQAPRLEAGQFVFGVSGLTVGRSHLVEASTNLVHWTAISTNLAAASTATYTNSAALAGQFFRVVELP